MTSTHVVRKAVVYDTAFDHQFHDFLDDTYDEDDTDDEVPETKSQNFEFSDGYGVMRMIRLIIVVQIISVALENPSLEMSSMVRIAVRGVLFYAIRFYSRPFIDLLYLIQYFLEAIINFVVAQHVPADPASINISVRRRLNTNPYLDNPDNTPGDGKLLTINIIDDRTWHTLKHYSHYILGVEFLVMAVLFTIYFWQISDYSNRSEVKVWLHRYISDGWWRRGGLNIAASMAKGLLALALVLLVINAFATQLSADTLPESRVVGGFLAVAVAVVLVVWLIGYIFIRFTEAAFVRYVSQNVSYTSAIILKRAVKAKLDLGLLLMCSLYLPVLYNLVQAVTLVTDWNDTLAPAFRKGVNFFVPCYYQAFPPYRQQFLAPDTCPVAQFTAPTQPLAQLRPNGFYSDSNILSCDSLLGIALFVFSASLVVYAVLGYYYVLHSFVRLVSREFRRSKFMDVLEKLIRIREEEEADFKSRFPFAARLRMAVVYELAAQKKHFLGAGWWLVLTVIRTLKGLLRAAYKSVKLFVIPIKFLLERVLVLTCMSYEAQQSNAMALRAGISGRFAALSGKGNSKSRRGSPSRKASSKSARPSAPTEEKEGDEQLGFSSKPSTRQASQQLAAQDNSGSSKSWLQGGEAGPGLSKKNRAMSLRSSKVALDKDYQNDLDGQQAEFSFSSKIAQYTARINVVQRVRRGARERWWQLRRAVARSSVVVWLKLQYSLLRHSATECWRHYWEKPAELDLEHVHKNAAQLGTAALGGASAAWRIERTIQNKFRLLHSLQNHIVAELRTSKLGYVADHDLLISVLDTTIDSAGLFTLVIPYQFTRLYWFLVVFLEITVYAVVGAALGVYTDWVNRLVAFLVVNNVFGLVTYLAQPYTELMDRWLDFAGRMLVNFILACTIICAQLRPAATASSPHSLYEPWEAASYLLRTLTHPGVYDVLDAMMVVFFYCYLFYVLYAVGALGVVERMVRGFQFGFHDHILDYLVENLDQRTFGLENMFTGLQLVQQWDDVIRLQRRYALLAWPDVRPPSIVSTLAKVLEIKWASLFNLTLSNLRSSLGLSILHTVMFAADGDVARWIIHANPDLLLVQDSQHDTPITIALKECAYFLMAYGEQNEGGLDDGTSYSDEQYAIYYPEVDDLRDEVYTHGEFVQELCLTHMLTSTDMVSIREEGVYREPPPETVSAGADSPKRPVKLDIHGNRKYGEDELAAMRAEKKRKAHARDLADKALREKNSVFAKRFPEDDLVDDYEVGRMASWAVIGMNVPEANLYLDASIVKKTLKNDNYSYEPPDFDVVRGRVVPGRVLRMDHAWEGRPSAADADLESGLSPHAAATATAAAISRRAAPDGGGGAQGQEVVQVVVPDKDLQYVVRSGRRLHAVDKAMEVPMTHEEIRGLVDWDKRPRRRRGSASGSRRESNASASQFNGNSERPASSAPPSDFGGTATRRSSMVSISSDLFSTASGELLTRLTRLNSAKTDRETRWRICKFAEILMSEEMSKSCSRMRWNLSDFKAFNKLASVTQGKIAQNLAMTCSLNAPPGFVRVSEWSASKEYSMFDEAPDDDIPMVVKTIVSLVSAAEQAGKAATNYVTTVVALPDINTLRGRARRRRRTSRSLSHKDNLIKDDQEGGSDQGAERVMSDRIIQYLAESYVCSNSHLNLDDCELSYNGRVGWRAIARALRLKHCSFVLPSLFVPPKLVRLTHLVLTRNELDCGDAVLLGDIFTHQLSLVFVDVSYNRIGGRGMARLAIALRDHPHLHTFKIDHNTIGPSAGKQLGLWIKKTRSLRVLSMSHNRMGEIVRYPTIYSREKILSAVHDIFQGVRGNKSLEVLDLSYNHLGPDSGDVVPPAVNRHPRLHTLNFAGNDLGPEKGTKFLFFLSGFPGGAAWAGKRDAFIANVKRKRAEDERRRREGTTEGEAHGPTAAKAFEVQAAGSHLALEGNGQEDSVVFSEPSGLHSHPLTPGNGAPPSPSQANALTSPQTFAPGRKQKSMSSTQELSAARDEAEAGCVHPCSLTSLSVADNQLNPFSGHGIASLIERNKALTHLDISGNALSHVGGMLVADQLELMYGIRPREFMKIVLWEIEESRYTGRNPKKRVKVYTTLTSLNMSRNGIGPSVGASLFYALGHPNCSITHLDVSDNPLGHTVQQAGDARVAGVDMRFGMTESRSLRFLNLSRTCMLPVEMVSILGGLVHNKNLMKLYLADIKLDEPSCLQLCTGLASCETLSHIDLQRCHMGANGSTLVMNKIAGLAERLRYVDLSDNYMGPVAAVYLSEALANPKCKIRTLRLARNDLIEEGGCFVARSLIGNISVTDLDLSGNFLTSPVAVYLADAARGLFQNGKKVTDSKFKRVLINDNPGIGPKASKTLVKALSNEHVEQLEIRNVGAKAGTANLIAASVRDPMVAWKILDVRQNGFSRSGLNQIFWAMRQNKRLRILRCGENQAGTKFCANEDSLLRHGISVPKCLRANVVMRELDLSFNTMCAEAGVNVLDAMIDNHTIKKLSLRGNLLDDSLAPMLGDLLRCNNVLEELDLGRNRLGFACAFAVAETLEINRSLKRLVIDYNNFGGAGTATLDAFSRSVMMNYSLQALVLDGNKLGPTWGVRLAETFVRNNTLLQVSLRDNRLDNRAGAALLRAYRHCPHLLELALSADEIGQELWEQFRLVFELKRASTAPGEYSLETMLSAAQAKIIASYALPDE